MTKNELQLFESPEGARIRTLTLEGKPWFVGQDLADNLGYRNGTRDICRHVEEEDRSVMTIFDGIQNRRIMIVNESGLYALILGSKMEGARKFKKWVTSEVLPSIRKNGGYIQNQENLSEEDLVAQAVIVAQNIINRQKKQIEELTPKAEFFDAVKDSPTTISMQQVAKILAVKGYGQNNLFKFLRSEKILDSWNMPMQEYVDRGWFKLIEQTYIQHEKTMVTTKTVVFQKGVDGIRKRLNAYLEKKEEKENADVL
ncbi:MAG: phage antirepressor KilAC domain-containing protein [Blautia sp.]|nr:phage antirepressor KilAC domain-containing protein [Blautia sp.]